MGLPKLKTDTSVEDYPESEKFTSFKREFVESENYVMVRTSDNHNLIAGEIYITHVNDLRNSSGQRFFGDIKAQVTRLPLPKVYRRVRFEK